MSKEQLEEIMDTIAYLRNKHVDTEMVSEYHGHDIEAEVLSCPISALLYTGDYIELLQKRVQELEEELYGNDIQMGYKRMYGVCNRDYAKLLGQNKRYREALDKQFKEFWEACVKVVGEDMAYDIVAEMPEEGEE